MSDPAPTAPDAITDLLLEGTEPGLPLSISFGFYAANNQPLFDFVGRLKKVALVSGRPANHLYLRDLRQLWYLRGIESLGQDVDSTVAALRRIIAPLAPSSITTLGQSMGAYAAILYGTLLGADRAIAFGPLSCFDGPRWALMKDTRWQLIRENLAASGANVAPYDDLAGLLRNHAGKRPAIDILYGMVGEDHIPTHQNIGQDVAHAMRFEGIEGITLLPLERSNHAVVEYLRQNGVITHVLMNRLYGMALTDAIEELYQSSHWMRWLEENIARGCDPATLRTTMREHQADDATITQLFERIYLIRSLRIIADHTPHVPFLSKVPYDPDEEEELAPCCSDPSHQHR